MLGEREMFEIRESLRDYADQIMAKYPEFDVLRATTVSIVCQVSDRSKTKDGKRVYAETTKVPEKFKGIVNCDFIITFYVEPDDLALDKLELLMYHELKHIGYNPTSGSCKIIPHDVEDFSDIIVKHGFNWIDDEE